MNDELPTSFGKYDLVAPLGGDERRRARARTRPRDRTRRSVQSAHDAEHVYEDVRCHHVLRSCSGFRLARRTATLILGVMGRQSGKSKRYAYGDYLHWPNGEQVELIDGVPYAMSPAPSTIHQYVVTKLAAQLDNAFSDKPCRVFVAPFDVRLGEEGQADTELSTVVQPDVVVVCDEGKLDRRGCRGAPDWVIEVLSPETAGKDQITKRALYERYGVKEYWLVHPVDRTVVVYTLTKKGIYAPSNIFETRDALASESFPGVRVDWDTIFRNVPTSTG